MGDELPTARTMAADRLSRARLVQGVPELGQRRPRRADPQRQGRYPARTAQVAVREVLLRNDGLRGNRHALRTGETALVIRGPLVAACEPPSTDPRSLM